MGNPFDKPTPRHPVSDRGPAKYFHGRTGALQKFSDQMELATKTDGGTIFLVQAAPGAGKTALLAECQRLAEADKWKTAEINPDDFWHTNTLLRSLGREKETKQMEDSWSGGLNASAGMGGLGTVQAGGSRTSKKTRAERTPLEALKSGKGKLLLILDEAQRLARTIQPSPHEQYVRTSTILDSIHNGKVGRPVILLAGGLGITESVLEGLGVSRIEVDSFVGLPPLREAATRAVIMDWIVEDGKAQGDPTPWIDKIAPETHGWPQHIIAYVKPALRQLAADGGAMTATGLVDILHQGRQLRTQYYARRTKGVTRRQRESIVRFLSSVPAGNGFEREDLVAMLGKDLGDKADPEAIFEKVLRKGVLEERDGEYVVPIPSMRDWLQERYGPSPGALGRSLDRQHSDGDIER